MSKEELKKQLKAQKLLLKTKDDKENVSDPACLIGEKRGQKKKRDLAFIGKKQSDVRHLGGVYMDQTILPRVYMSDI